MNLYISLQPDGKADQLEQERYQLGLKVLERNHAPLAQVQILLNITDHSNSGSACLIPISLHPDCDSLILASLPHENHTFKSMVYLQH